MKYLIHDKIRLGVAVLLCFCTALQTDAKVKLPALISDGMVLQREQPVKVWGTADAGERVSVTFMKKKYAATADNNGQWNVTLPPMKAGGPYLMQINDIKLNDILIGDVWLCSGQSNMELPVSRVTDMFAAEISEYSNERIRQIIVPKVYNFHAPQETTLYNNIKEQYNLSADANQLLLEDIQGKTTNLSLLLKKHKGKVIYVDFWSSWCVPCREEMVPSAKLRELYKGKDVAFVYLAYKDTKSSWKKAAKQEGLAEIENNFIITNSKNSKTLEAIKLDLIPRYIIFDKQGSLVEMNAPRPSDKQVTTIIEKYLRQ